jgi:hypothetical protein
VPVPGEAGHLTRPRSVARFSAPLTPYH